MDSLDHMLTDPLELGSCGEGNGTGIMEDCMLGRTRVSLPEDLLEDPEIFFDVVSETTWKDVLTESQREHLKKFLPQFPGEAEERQEQVITSLFGGENFRFGNPLHLAQKLFRDGHFNPEVVKYRQLCFKSQYKRYLCSQQQYFHKLLKQILASRKELLDLARQNGPNLEIKRNRVPPVNIPEERDKRTQRRYLKVLQEIKDECGDSTLSSEEEDLSSWLPTADAHSPSPPVPLRIIPTLSTADMKTADKPELDDCDLKLMMRMHRDKRKRQPGHPDLAIGDLTLSDVMARVNAGRKGSLAALFDFAVLKKKAKDERKRRKLKVIKKEEDDFPEPLNCPDVMPSPLKLEASVKLETPLPVPIHAVKEEPLEDVKPALAFNEISANFFCLLLDILLLEGPSSLPLLEDRVLEWQSSPASTLNLWFSSAPNWCELVHPALLYLTGERKGTSNFPPFVEFREKTMQWKWIGPTQDSEKELNALFQIWLETKDQICSKDDEDSIDESTPDARMRTDYVVTPSSGDEKRVFQEQERLRYSQPHKAFTFRMHGFESVVGPVKGVFDKETSLNKAREHSLLRSDRPAYVTILSLVRDAAARLPNGEGTRAEICELLKDSQFLAPDVTSAQVNTVVSGALDRLHYEKDPCVKYDIGRKLWIYLHRDRTEEEFERIHQAHAAAAKAKKALQQKPKTPAKVKTNSKEGSLKVMGSGPSEPGPSSFAETSIPTTPGTPGTPTTPVLPSTPLSPLPVSAVTKPLPTVSIEPSKPSQSVLLMPSPSLGTLLSPTPTPQALTGTQTATRVVSHSVASGLPQVRVVTTASSLPTVSQQTSLVTSTLQQLTAAAQLRIPTTATPTKVLPQTMVSVPVKTQVGPNTIQVQRAASSLMGPGSITVTGINTVPSTTKSATSSPPGSTSAVLRNLTGQNVLKQVAITGQLGMKAQPGTSIPLTTTNFRIQGKDVLRLPPSSITTDAKGQTVLRITPDMMATLAKSQVTTVKLSQDLFTAAGSASNKGLSTNLHMPSTSVQSTDSPVKTVMATSIASSPVVSAAVKVTSDLKISESVSSAYRLMPALGATLTDQKGKALGTITPTDSKPATTIRIVQGLMPPKPGQTFTVSAKQVSASAVGLASSIHTPTVTLPTVSASVSKTIAVSSGVGGSPITFVPGTTTMRQVPVTTTVVSTSQTSKLPARISVPLSMISQPVKGKSIVTSPLIKGNIGTNLSGLGRNIILTTMPAGTKLITGHKPVSFLTAHQLQQLQQQGQATQVRIQTVPATHLQQGTAAGSSKPVSTVVVATAPSSKQAPDHL
ncbi:nuclear factor related to kappa-B-binding protein isoform X1 [Pleurodeles waltl]